MYPTSRPPMIAASTSCTADHALSHLHKFRGVRAPSGGNVGSSFMRPPMRLCDRNVYALTLGNGFLDQRHDLGKREPRFYYRILADLLPDQDAAFGICRRVAGVNPDPRESWYVQQQRQFLLEPRRMADDDLILALRDRRLAGDLPLLNRNVILLPHHVLASEADRHVVNEQLPEGAVLG